MEQRRVVITGMGPITPIGTGTEAYWRALLDGISGVGPITHFDASDYSTRIAAEVKDFDPEQYVERKEAKRMDRFVQLAVAASKLAVQDAGLDIRDDNADRIGVLIGSGIGGTSTWEEQHSVLIEKGPRRVSPFFVPMLISDMASGMVSILLGAKGPNLGVVSACATATHAIGEASEIIKRGDADVMLAGGSEAAITPMSVAGFCAARAFSTRNDEPERASRPFDLHRDGFVMGEGAGTVIVELLDHALARGARICAEIIGYGMSGDAFHITAPPPGGEGAARSMAAALLHAGIRPEQVDYINAHGTSTQDNDSTETAAIKTVFGGHAYKVAISSTKSMTGHLLGAAGAVEAIACICSIRDGIVHPTTNYETPDPECDLDYVPNTARKLDVQIAMSNSFGFGGHNATLVLAKYEGQPGTSRRAG
ncbi:MAG TPA: beta-ketoacyl-ACP synthase II [Armatimonadota bacterium]|nr:beta-ketoacyl-ACP synthase II [Armatimonadota bacterium]